MKCYYEQKRHPYLYINPIKVEQLSESPPLVQMYEMLGESEIERIKEVGTPYLTLSGVIGSDGYEAITDFRTSVGTGLFHEELPNVIKLAEIVSGLKLFNSSEYTQMVEYTYGRYYTYHTDALQGEDEATEELGTEGDRVATILYYLELPTYGGLTPFCTAGVSAYPIRGSAIMWYNVYKNGSVRNDVNHGACPVIHGNKIIINHWVRYGGNLHAYKCSLNQFE